MTASSLLDDPILAKVPVVDGFKVLGPVVLYAKIGQGGMGSVYRGLHLNLDIELAVKCLKRSLAEENPEFITRFEREAKIAARIGSENLIRVFDVGSSNGLHYFVMEYVLGESLGDRVRRKGPLDVVEAVAIMSKASRGIGDAHEAGVVHRDIKPDNILISTKGHVKVADLGLARAADSTDSLKTHSRMIMGTPEFMPVEQFASAASVGPEGDVYALGATLFFLLSGRPPFTGNSPTEVMYQVANSQFPDIRRERPDCPTEVAEIIERATRRNAVDRYPNAGQLTAALESVLARFRVAANLADQNAGRSRGESQMFSPPPAETFARIRQVLQTGASRSTEQRGELPRERGFDHFRDAATASVPVLPQTRPALPPRINPGPTTVDPFRGQGVRRDEPSSLKRLVVFASVVVFLIGAIVGGVYVIKKMWESTKTEKKDGGNSSMPSGPQGGSASAPESEKVVQDPSAAAECERLDAAAFALRDRVQRHRENAVSKSEELEEKIDALSRDKSGEVGVRLAKSRLMLELDRQNGIREAFDRTISARNDWLKAIAALEPARAKRLSGKLEQATSEFKSSIAAMTPLVEIAQNADLAFAEIALCRQNLLRSRLDAELSDAESLPLFQFFETEYDRAIGEAKSGEFARALSIVAEAEKKLPEADAAVLSRARAVMVRNAAQKEGGASALKLILGAGSIGAGDGLAKAGTFLEAWTSYSQASTSFDNATLGSRRTLNVPGEYATIAVAIQNAFPGDVVKISEGVYFESFTVDKGVILQGDGAGKTIIRTWPDRNIVWFEKADGAAMFDLAVEHTARDTGPARYRTVVVNGGKVVIRRCTIEGSSGSGIDCLAGAAVVVDDCVVRGSGLGGIHAGEGTTLDVFRSVVNKGMAGGIESEKATIRLTSVFLNDNAGHGLSAIESQVAMTAVRSWGSGASGAFLTACQRAEIYGCEFANSAVCGVEIGGQGGQVSLINVRCHDNKSAGIQVSSQASMNLLYGDLESNGLSGVFAREASTVAIDRTLIQKNGACGLFSSGNGTKVTAGDCFVFGNTHHGLYAEKAARLDVADCYLLQNGYSGLHFHDGPTSGTVARTSTFDNSQWGVSVGDGAVIERKEEIDAAGNKVAQLPR